MRVVGGTLGGRIVKVPKGFDVRPTPDLVKQALFNSLGGRVEGSRVLELFGGSGALSLESLSRGAVHAVCVEKATRHARMIQANFAAVGIGRDKIDLRVEDAFVAVHQLSGAGRVFDLILADPPYGEKNVNKRSSSFAQKLLDDAFLPSLLSADGVFVLGHSKRDTLAFPAVWEEVKTLKHGDSIMRILKKAVKA